MRHILKKASETLALLVIFALLQVYVLATPIATTTNTANDARSNVAPSALLFGRLSTFGAGKVSVNGNEAASGTTILSGAQIETPEATGATVTLASVGTLDIAPKTTLTVTFNKGSVTVNVIAGDARLTTEEGVRGTLTTPDGKTEVTDAKGSASVGTTMYAADGAGSPQPNRACRILHIPCALFWAMVGGGTLVALYYAFFRGNNPSQSTP
ncbi:MAG: hypothetical protein DMF68_14845 [Acidobacteria bacterium]|nr:MAG: hypothetical protein DMF68_14845 [Acidobacteriota bacterium]